MTTDQQANNPTPHLNCTKNPLYHDACIFDGVLIQVCSWVVFEECPLGAGSLLAHIFYCLFSSFIHLIKISVVLYVRLHSYCISFGTVFTFARTSDMCTKLLLATLLTYLLFLTDVCSTWVTIMCQLG